MKPDLKEQVRSQLQALKGHWPEVAKRGGVSVSWVSQFVRGITDNPLHERLVKLRKLLLVMEREVAKRKAARAEKPVLVMYANIDPKRKTLGPKAKG